MSEDHTSSMDKGRDSVTDAMDAYLLNGHEALRGWFGSATAAKKPEYVAVYMLGCAAIHGAELIAQAMGGVASSIDRLSAAVAQDRQAKTTAIRPGHDQ